VNEGPSPRVRTRLPLYVAIAAAVAGTALLEVHKGRFEAEVTGGEVVQVLTVQRDVEVGQRVASADVGTEAIPLRFLDRRRARAADLTSLVGVPARTALRAGDGLNYDDLALGSADGRDLAGLIPDGLRAVSLAVDAFDGLLRPGDRVDVLVAQLAADGPAPRARVVVQRTLVLAVGGRISDEKATRASSGTVVVAVSPEDAAILAQTTRGGRVTLALRNPADLAAVAAVDEVKPAVAARPAPPRPAREVERVR
jgi:pilus assembly protein CpaB